ncbi:MAG: FG-GAP repeat domain-containing protein [Verrucomicrobiota bacterium]
MMCRTVALAWITGVLLAGEAAPPLGGLPAGGLPGKLAATTYCTQCHALPDPSHLDRRTWETELLPKMRVLVGLEKPGPHSGFQDVPLLEAAGVFPAKPLVPAEAFEAAARYFLERAPEKTASVQDQATIAVGMKGFRTEILPDRHAPPRTTMVRIDGKRHRLFLGDAGFQGYNLLNGRLEVTDGVKLANIPTSWAGDAAGDWFTCIGHFFPREEPRGQVMVMETIAGKLERRVVLSGLPRLADLKRADLNGDGRNDLVLCAYGNYVGRFSWFETAADGGLQERMLFDKPGSLRCEAVDFDRDGHLDLLVLVAQATESLLFFKGDGRGRFERQTLFQRDPSWGHSGFELADFDGDGRLDVLVTNGDNADFNTSPPHSHHGVRIYLNRAGKLEESWFAPMNGAYRAVARDFDLDGDLDVAAIAFFPDYEASPRESFLYFENTGGKTAWKFSRSTFAECIAGRWLTLDAGDLDGDGDEDLALGSLIEMPTQVPDFLKDSWRRQGPSLLVLRNLAR